MLLLLGAHCALVFDPDALGPGPPLADAGGAEAARDDAAALDGGNDGRGPTGLDDGVSLPALDGLPCSRPTGVDPACGVGNACRLATPDSGRCESCDTGCRTLVGKACSRSHDCDSFLTCFRGRCSPSCLLGEHECGPVEACLDVGYQGLGLCDPSTL